MNNSNRTIHTIDEKHTTMIDSFHENETIKIPQLQEEKQKLKDYIRSLTPQQVEEIIETKDKIKSIQKEINRLKIEKKQYFLNNSRYVFDYFEQKQQISTIEKPSQHDEVIHSFFKIKSKDNEGSNINSNKYLQ